MKKRFSQLLQQVRQSALISQGDILVAGVSGGADSVLLLRVLAAMRETERIDLYAVHVHHGIRGAEADEDAAFVQKLCEELGIPCRVDRADVPALAKAEGLSVEEAGRKARYQCFYREMDQVGAHKLAVAHHRDDSAETILFNLVRGSGLKGLCGISQVQGRIIRPLISLRRREIESILSEEHLSWRTDSTNTDVRYSRNRIRHELIPYLEREFNPETVEHLTEMASMLREIDRHMEREASVWLDRYAKKGSLPVERLKQEDEALQGYLIRMRLAEPGGLKDITRDHVEAVRSLLNKNGAKTICLPGGRRVRREYEMLRFFVEEEDREQGMLPVEMICEEISLEKFEKISPDPYTKCFDYDKIDFKLCLRTRKPGDSMVVFADGRSQSVKDYMINAKIPAGLRDRIPLLVSGDEVLWVAGYRTSEKFRVTEHTRRILQVTVKLRENKEQEIR